jgi:hypothetical protein
MATKEVFLSGKTKFAHFHQPDKFGFWSVNIYLDDASKVEWAKLRQLGIMNRLRKDDEGDYVTLRRPVEKKIRGTMTKMEPVYLFKDGIPYLGMIGNGSDVTCTITVYNYRKPQTQEQGTAIRLAAVRIHNLVEPSPKQLPPEGQKAAATLAALPDPIW